MPKSEVPIAVLLQYFRVPTGEIAVDYPGRQVLLGSRITNISTTGVFVRTANPLPKDTSIDLVFTLPGSKAEIKATAVVRWSTELADDSDPSIPTGMGLEFTKLAARHRKLIERYVEDFLSRMRKGK
jgi:uncharacterized protein (TIGR02266 family)